MAYINSNSVKTTIVKEVVEGTVPTTGNRLELPRKQGSALPTVSGGDVTSDTIRPGLNSNGSRRGNQSVSVPIELNAITADCVDLLMESAVGGTFATNVLKAGAVGPTFSHITELASNEFLITSGIAVTDFSLNAEAAGAVTLSFSATGQKQVKAATVAGTMANVAVPDTAYEYQGAEVLNVTAAGSTALNYSNLSLTVASPKNPRNVLSSNTPKGMTASGLRSTTLVLTFYRETGVDYAALFSGAIQTFSFDLGLATYGRKFTVYGNASIPQDDTQDDMMVTVTVTGAYMTSEATSLKIEKL